MKDELLEGLDSIVLLKLATSASESPIESGTTRAELVRIIKGSLSVEEIIRKLKQEEGLSGLYKLTGAELTAGGVGQVFLAVSGAISTVGYYAALTGGSMLGFYLIIAPWGLVSSIAVLLFAVLLTVSIMKIPREIGGLVGRATSLFGMIAAIVGIMLYSLVIMRVVQISYLSVLYVILSISYAWLLGTTMALLGAFFLVCRKHSASGDLWIASGILYIVGGGSLFGITALLYVPSAPFIAAIVGAVCFFTGKPPE